MCNVFQISSCFPYNYHGLSEKKKDEIRVRLSTRTVDEQVRTRRWKRLGHVLRMPSDKNPKIALTWAPESKRRRGRPRETWRRTVNKERGHLGFKTIGQNGATVTAGHSSVNAQ